MNPKETIISSGAQVGCADMDDLKKWYWAMAQGYAEETVLFLASAYYVVKSLERGERPGDRMKLLFDEFICSRPGDPLYVNVMSHQRNKAQNVVDAGAYENYGYALPPLADCVAEVAGMLRGKKADNYDSLSRNLNKFSNPRRKSKSQPWWSAKLFGTRYKPIPMAKVPGEKIDIVKQHWGPSPWLWHLSQMS